MTPQQRQQHDALVKAYTDKGKLIEAGFAALRLQVIPASASKTQVDEMRMAFFLGAQHLFASFMAVFDPESEPTAADLSALGKIDAELSKFAAEFALRAAPTGRKQ
ncbi:hypothetical protein [Nevskia sp.]|uniref:hypothetical protein n=1 Tax=Nevskia sp. TaxID=1929292 RepID=UPI0025E6CEE2|nr:hypothetical protein [Nevskia sp.]